MSTAWICAARSARKAEVVPVVFTGSAPAVMLNRKHAGQPPRQTIRDGDINDIGGH